MKKLITLIFVFIACQAISQEQDYAEIEFIPYSHTMKEKHFEVYNFKIYLNDESIVTINGDEILNYKIYSKGRINVTSIVRIPVSGIIDVNENKKYYFVVGNLNKRTRYSEITEEMALEIKSEWEYSKTIEIEEDVSNPIGKLPDSFAKKNRPSQGTGFLLNQNGFIITNFHVIEGADKIMVLGVKGDHNIPFEAEIISIDRHLDLALLKVESNLFSFESPPYLINSSNETKQGEEVVAFGYPIKDIMGSEVKVTNGIINSESGFLGTISEFQISASVQPGNSGGPLLNGKGEVIGIVSAKISSQSVEQVGYAIKSDYLKFFLDQIGGIDYNNGTDNMKSKELTEQIQIIKNFIYIIETE